MSTDDGVSSTPASTFEESIRVDPNPLYRLFYKTQAKTLIPTQRSLITIPDSITIFDALSILHKNKIIAAPVLNPEGSCVGSIDVLSMLTYTTTMYDLTSPQQLWSHIKDLTVGEIVASVIETKKLVPFYSENPVSMLIDLFGTRIHRVALFHSNKELIATLSQSDVVRFISTVLKSPEQYKLNSILLDAVFNKKSSEYKLLKVVESIPSTMTMFEAMKTLADSARHGLAVVNDQGHLVGHISVSDLHDLPEANFTSLNMTVIHWLQAFSSSALTPSRINSDITFYNLIHRFVDTKQHRLWCVNEQGVATHVVSLTDVLSALGSGDKVDHRMASGDTNVNLLWRINSPYQ